MKKTIYLMIYVDQNNACDNLMLEAFESQTDAIKCLRDTYDVSLSQMLAAKCDINTNTCTPLFFELDSNGDRREGRIKIYDVESNSTHVYVINSYCSQIWEETCINILKPNDDFTIETKRAFGELLVDNYKTHATDDMKITTTNHGYKVDYMFKNSTSPYDTFSISAYRVDIIPPSQNSITFNVKANTDIKWDDFSPLKYYMVQALDLSTFEIKPSTHFDKDTTINVFFDHTAYEHRNADIKIDEKTILILYDYGVNMHKCGYVTKND